MRNTADVAINHASMPDKVFPILWYYPGSFFRRISQGNASGPDATWVTGQARGPDTTVSFAVVADFDVTGDGGSVTTAERLAALVAAGVTGPGNEAREPLPLDFLLHVGDLGYGTGDVAIWETFMGLIAPLTASLPYHVSIGACVGSRA